MRPYERIVGKIAGCVAMGGREPQRCVPASPDLELSPKSYAEPSIGFHDHLLGSHFSAGDRASANVWPTDAALGRD